MLLPAPERPTRPIFSPGRMCSVEVVDDRALRRRSAKLHVLEADLAARAPRSGCASGRSTTVCGRDSVLMPSCTVPTCSNSEAISHMTQCEMPFRRSAIAVAAATAPTPTWPCVHSHSVSAGGAQRSAAC